MKITLVGHKEMQEAVLKINTGLKGLDLVDEGIGYLIAEAAEALIIQTIRDEMPTEEIGNFMANRTKVESTFSGNVVVLTISGKTEGETEDRARSDGSMPTAPASANLWAVHEFGRSGDAGGGVTYVKDIGGVKVTRKSRSAGAGSPYKGSIRRLVRGLSYQLEALATELTVIAADTVIAASFSSAGVKIDIGAQAALDRANITTNMLENIGVKRVAVSSTGQISLIGSPGGKGTSAYISGASIGVPTTIRK